MLVAEDIYITRLLLIQLIIFVRKLVIFLGLFKDDSISTNQNSINHFLSKILLVYTHIVDNCGDQYQCDFRSSER